MLELQLESRLEMARTVNIVIADDHPVFRAGLKQILESEESIKVVGEADNGTNALSLINELSPDVAILDIRMPGKSGLQILSELFTSGCSTKIVLLTSFKNEAYFFNAIANGTKGYVLKNDALINIVDAVKIVAEGGQYLSPALNKLVFKHNSNESIKNISEFLSSLTRAECEVMKLIAEWKTNKEIADQLCISPRTVGNHRTNISSKLNITGTNGLVKFSIENKDLL